MHLYHKMKSALERIAAETNEDSIKSIALEALPAPKPEPAVRKCAVCGNATPRPSVKYCSDECKMTVLSAVFEPAREKRRERARLAAKLKGEGLTYRQVGERMGLSVTRATGLVHQGQRLEKRQSS